MISFFNKKNGWQNANDLPKLSTYIPFHQSACRAEQKKVSSIIHRAAELIDNKKETKEGVEQFFFKLKGYMSENKESNQKILLFANKNKGNALHILSKGNYTDPQRCDVAVKFFKEFTNTLNDKPTSNIMTAAISGRI